METRENVRYGSTTDSTHTIALRDPVALGDLAGRIFLLRRVTQVLVGAAFSCAQIQSVPLEPLRLASATTVLSQTMTHRQTEFQFVSIARAEKVAADIGRIRPEVKGEPAAERESAPTGQRFVVLRFSLPYAPQSNARRADARLLGTVPERGEPQAFRCDSTYTWVPVNGTWSAAFVFLVPDEEPRA